MRQLILQMSMSVDGFVGDANGKTDWIFKTMDDGSAAWTMECLRQAGMHIMGSHTFREMAAYWPSSSEPLALAMNEIPKAVFTRHGLGNGHDGASGDDHGLRPAPANESSWAEATVVRGELSAEIQRMKEEPGKDIVAHGGASFAQSLIRHGLVDEYRLLVHPIALGTGLPLFSGLPERSDLTLMQATRFPSGAVAHVYRAHGAGRGNGSSVSM